MPRNIKRECIALNCRKEGKKKCSSCEGAYYCSRECQKKHWKLHKKTCQYIRTHRTQKVKREDLYIKPWTSQTPYEQKQRDWQQYERCYEKKIAKIAKNHIHEKGIIVCDLKNRKNKWYGVDKINSCEGPCLNRDAMRDIVMDCVPGYSYCAMAVWGKLPKYQNMEWASDAYLKFYDCPISQFGYGGRGSTQYQGPLCINMFLEEMKKGGCTEEQLQMAAGNMTSWFDSKARTGSW